MWSALVISFLTTLPASSPQEVGFRLLRGRDPNPKLRLDVPIVDVPIWGYASQARANRRNGRGSDCTDCGVKAEDVLIAWGADPSMRGAVAWSLNLHGSAYYGWNTLWHHVMAPTNLGRTIANRILAYGTAAATDYLITFYAPFGAGWLHEEFHRSVMNRRGIFSENEIWEGALERVNEVLDEDLERLKARHPAEMVRLSSAGAEGHIALVQAFEVENFFFDANYPFAPLGFVYTWYAADYFWAPLKPGYDDIVEELYERAPTPLERDFVGVDSAAWVYDLFRPDEPYADRGVAPNGVGIDRYIRLSELTGEEVAYLEKTATRMYLNLISPFLIGVQEIGNGRDWGINFAVRAFPTPFGLSTGVDVFWRSPGKQWLISAAVNEGQNVVGPSVGFRWLQIPLSVLGAPLEADVSLSVWSQPEDMLFRATSQEMGVHARVQLAAELGRVFRPYVDVEAKSAGWVASNPFLDANLSLRAGFRLYL